MATYKMKIAGLDRELKKFAVSDKLDIAAFILFGDVEITIKSAEELLKKVPEFDIIVTPEAKSIPLAYEMARQSGENRYFVARKKAKAYMQGVFEVEVQSITTAGTQTLLSAIITPEEQAALGVEWAIDNEEIATVDQDGVVTANEGVVGEVVVTATCNGVVAEYILKVVLPPETVEIAEPETTMIDMNSDVQTIQLTASVDPEGASQRIIWESLNDKLKNHARLNSNITKEDVLEVDVRGKRLKAKVVAKHMIQNEPPYGKAVV